MALERGHQHKFMIPETSNQPFIEYDDDGETYVVPADVQDILPASVLINELWTGKWFTRLHAPGYLDATDWSGPYNTHDGALWELYQMYGDAEGETFWNFIGAGHKIIKGTLRLKESETRIWPQVYGQVAGEEVFGKPRIEHIGEVQVDTSKEPELLYDDDGEPYMEYYDPNKDQGIEHNMHFEFVSEAEHCKLARRISRAQVDKEVRNV